MLKKTVKYETFDGDTVEEELLFNLTPFEFQKLDDKHHIQDRLKDTLEVGAIVDLFASLVLAAYGERSLDGKRFIKSEEKRIEFEQSLAYEALMFEMFEDEKTAMEFFKGILSTRFQKLVERAEKAK